MTRCPFCGGVGEEMDYDCDFSLSEIKLFICQHCGTSFKARSDQEGTTATETGKI